MSAVGAYPNIVGMHLGLRGFVPLPATSSAIVRIGNALGELVEKIEMTPIAGPLVYERPDVIIGVCIIAESHIMCHWTRSGVMFWDIFSCKSFDAMRAQVFVERAFPGTWTRDFLLERRT